jgi:hypothetical protein
MRFGKKELLGFAAAALMTLGTALPTLAGEDTGTVTVSAVVQTHLDITVVSSGTVSFNPLDLGDCNTSSSVHIQVDSNGDYTGTVSAAFLPGNTHLIEADLYRVGTLTPADPSVNCTVGSFGTDPQTWPAGGGMASLIPTSYYEWYGVLAPASSSAGTASWTLTYSASNS